MRTLALLALSPVLLAESLTGVWSGTVTVNKLEIPFRFEIQAKGSQVNGTFFNGDQRFTSTSGQLDNDSLTLNWDYFAAKLDAKLVNGDLDGTYSRSRGRPYHFHAVRFTPPAPMTEKIPQIGGIWIIEGVKSSKAESAWHLIVKQKGAEADAAILRIDGDTGTLHGSYKDGKFVLSHFSGMRPALLEITPAGGKLNLVLDGRQQMSAVRPAVAEAENLPEPADPMHHTGVKDPSQRFHFSFPDLNGNVVSDTDPRFKGKVVLVDIMGSWCPNCHDEAPFLTEVYRKYRAQGLEVVALSFEEADQLKDPVRLRAFVKRYGIDYTVLLGGDTKDAHEKLSQTSNWDSWPTTFILGRDGKVKAVHAGFPSKASGELYAKATEEFTAEVEHLLAQNPLTLQ